MHHHTHLSHASRIEPVPSVFGVAPEVKVAEYPIRNGHGAGASGDDVAVCRGQPQRVVLTGVAHRRDGRDDQLGTDQVDCSPQGSGSSTQLGSARTTSNRSSGACLTRLSMWSWARYPLVSPVWTSRLRLSSFRACVETIASRRLGTRTCGMTDVNHDPGPRKTQSASRIASSVCVGQPGAGGRMRTPCTRPRVEATRCWPRTMVTASGYAGSWPTISASISSGTPAMGRTRPRELRSRPTRSRPSTVSPSRSQRDTMRRLPRACPASGPSPWNRCWSTSRQVWPHSVSSHSEASAIRRSPGGSTANSSRKRPDDPPSSATVTTAVTRSVSSLRAERDDARPCPPPRATTLG